MPEGLSRPSGNVAVVPPCQSKRAWWHWTLSCHAQRWRSLRATRNASLIATQWVPRSPAAPASASVSVTGGHHAQLPRVVADGHSGRRHTPAGARVWAALDKTKLDRFSDLRQRYTRPRRPVWEMGDRRRRRPGRAMCRTA